MGGRSARELRRLSIQRLRVTDVAAARHVKGISKSKVRDVSNTIRVAVFLLSVSASSPALLGCGSSESEESTPEGADFEEHFNEPMVYCNPEEDCYPFGASLFAGGQFVFKDGLVNGCDSENVVCTFQETQPDGTGVAVLSVGPDPTPGDLDTGYNNADWEEHPPNSSFGKGLERWCPTEGHAIVMDQRVKYDPIYTQDGLSAATGTLGGGLWNNPVDPTGFKDPTLVSWMWNENLGLTVLVMHEWAPLLLKFIHPDVLPVDTANWMVQRIRWEKLASGEQRIEFSLAQGDEKNFVPVAEVVTAAAIPCLSTELWNDNRPGIPVYTIHNPTTVQRWYMDWLKIDVE